MFVADSKRLTSAGAKHLMATAIGLAEKAGVAVTVAIADAGGNLLLLERMEGGRFHTVRSATTKAVCAASNRRATGSRGAQGQALDVGHAVGLALAAGAENWTAMEGGCPILVGGECIGGIGVPAAIGSSTNGWRARRSSRSEPAPVSERLAVGCVGIGWWSDVLADAMQRSGKFTIAACFSRSQDKRTKFAAKYGCRAVPAYEAMLEDGTIKAIVNTTPNGAHLETTRVAAAAGKHVFLDKPIANTIADARAIATCRAANWFWRWATSAAAKASFAGSGVPSMRAASASSSMPRPTSAVTGWARSTSRRGAIPRRVRRAA